jgi:large subunit ribosomal protein L15
MFAKSISSLLMRPFMHHHLLMVAPLQARQLVRVQSMGFGYQSAERAAAGYLDFAPNTVRDNPGARRKAKVLGRGPGSGKGKTSGRGHKGQYSRSGGTINRGFEGGQTPMSKKWPKRGFRAGRFNNGASLEQLNLGKLAYFIQKGVLDPNEPITFKVLLDKGIVTKIKDGVKILGKGTEIFKSLGVAISIEASDASETAIAAVKECGGSIKVVYRTPLILRKDTKPHKYEEYQKFKTPMPPPKVVKKLEKIRNKGMEVEYPAVPWFDRDQSVLEKEAIKKRMAEAQHADLLEQIPADRSAGVNVDKPRIQKPFFVRQIKYL